MKTPYWIKNSVVKLSALLTLNGCGIEYKKSPDGTETYVDKRQITRTFTFIDENGNESLDKYMTEGNVPHR